MKKIVLGCFVTGAMALTACSSSSDPCATFYSAQAAATANGAPCVGDAGVTVPNDGGTQATCDAILAGTACSSADKTALETAATNISNCVTSAGTCSPADAGAWATVLTTCEGAVEVAVINGDAGVSAACFAAVSAPGGI